MTDALLLVLVCVAIFAVSAGRRFGHLSAISLFVYAQAAMAIGTLPLLSPASPADLLHRDLILVTLGVLVLVAFFFSVVSRLIVGPAYRPEVDYSYPKAPTWLLIVMSLAITVLYYWNIGYVAFFESIDVLATGRNEDVAALRLESYSGSRYLFPGYVNQFKNSLLPALAMVVIVSSFHLRSRGRFLLLLTLGPAVVIALLGTGQRGAFVIVAAIAVVMSGLIKPHSIGKYILGAALVVLPIFFISTLAGGRANAALQTADGIGGMIGVLFGQLISRLFDSNQLSSVVGFRFIYDQPVTNGAEWVQGLVGILPGQPGSDLSNQIFAVLYGSTRGTAPLSLWGSAYHNFGFVGAVVVAVLLTALLCHISWLAKRENRTNLIRTVGVAGVTVTLAMWIADGPTTLLNTGVVVYVLLWLWGSNLLRRQAETGPVAVRATKAAARGR